MKAEIPPALLDVNLLIALSTPTHVHFNIAQTWYGEVPGRPVRACPVTQAGFLRIRSNRNLPFPSLTAIQAVTVLNRISQLPGYEFWTDDTDFSSMADDMAQVTGHN